MVKVKAQETAAAVETAAAMPQAGNDANVGVVTVLDRFKAQSIAVSEKAEQSAITQQQIRQTLAEAKDLLNAGDAKAKEARALTAVAGLSLYQGKINALFSIEQVNAILGDQFGYKEKQDGTASKTPQGEGEAIRKRVMRLVQAHDYVVSNEATKFFEPLEKDAVAHVLAQVESGQMSIYSAYDVMTEYSRKAKQNIPAAFNPKAILKLVDTLTGQPLSAIEAFTGENAGDLIQAYTALQEAVSVILSAPVDTLDNLPIG